MIIESGLEAATNSDLLSGGRLANIPYNGTLTLEFLATDSDATNFYQLTVQKPDGSVPIDTQRLPGANPALAGVLDERQLIRLQFQATQGGRFLISVTENGTSTLTWRATLSP